MTLSSITQMYLHVMQKRPQRGSRRSWDATHPRASSVLGGRLDNGVTLDFHDFS